MMNVWPYNGSYTLTYGSPTLDQIRQVVKEEIHKALRPDEQGTSATVEYVQNGKHWKGIVYLIEDDEQENAEQS